MKRRIIIVTVIAVAFIGAFLAFRPDRLFSNHIINEDIPAVFATGRQKLETGTFHTALHPTNGIASIYQAKDGSRILRLTNFSTSNGPDVHIYVVSAQNPIDNDGVKEAEFIDLGTIKGNVGDQNYALGPDVDLAKYKSVVVWCKRFAFNFGYAPLSPSHNSDN
jgi:hypothetical protein